MAELMQDIKHIPPWLIIAGVGGIGAVVLLVRRGSGSGAVVSTVPAASITATPDGALAASGLAGGPALGAASQLQSMSTLPQASVAPTAPPAPSTPTFLNLFGDITTPRSYEQGIATLNQLAERDPNNAAYQEWVMQGYAFNPTGAQPGALEGNSAAWAAWVQHGRGFIGQETAIDQGQPPAAGGGSAERIVDILPHGYATEMSPGVLQRWADWMGGNLPQAGLDDTQRYVARTTHRELAARHKAAADDAVNELLGGI